MPSTNKGYKYFDVTPDTGTVFLRIYKRLDNTPAIVVETRLKSNGLLRGAFEVDYSTSSKIRDFLWAIENAGAGDVLDY